MSIALDRDALYYPCIQIHDVNWLKATLLCFPQVRRMVPPYFDLKDSAEIQEFRQVNGPRKEPLLIEEDTNQYIVYQAQKTLLEKIRNYGDEIIQRFSEEAAKKENVYDSFQIH